MSDPLSHVQPGDPLAISASGWNQIVDLVRAKNGAGGPGALPANLERPALAVRVQASGTLPNRAIVTLGDALIDPDTDPLEAARTPLFECAAPVSGDVPAVLLSGLSSGEIGRAVVSGVCVAPVEVTSTAHEYAAPVAGDLFALASATNGPFRLLTRPGTGTHKCLLLLGSAGADESAEGGCAGCGWVAGLTDLDCLVASVVERLGRCACDPCDTATTAARYPTAATSTPGTGAFSEWNNVEGVFAAGEDESAGCGLFAGEASGDLVATGFGFTIPTGATIKGVSVSVGRYDNMAPAAATDHTVKLVKAGVAVGTNKASGSTWPNSLTEATYGGAADLWGATWTPAEINASTFGVSFTAQHAGASGESAPVVDWIRVTVTYEECEAVNSGPLYLTTEGGADWTAAAGSDPATITICGVEYALTFSKEGCDGPCLTLTADAGSGTAYTAVRDCCGPNYAIFSIGATAVCTGTTDDEAGPVGNTARIKVEWSCCPAEGYDGPGYYCVRDAGTEDECAAVEVLSADDVCASAIEICDGPFETLEEAQAACPVTVALPAGGVSCSVGTSVSLNTWYVGRTEASFDGYYCIPVAPDTQYKLQLFSNPDGILHNTSLYVRQGAGSCESDNGFLAEIGEGGGQTLATASCITAVFLTDSATTHLCVRLRNSNVAFGAYSGFKISAGSCA